jgi:hypothetical protein
MIGISLILIGMLFGDIFAVFVLHQNASRINDNLFQAVQAVAQRNPGALASRFQNIGGLLENRGTKVDAHSHMIGFGYIALLLALAQPFIGFTETTKKKFAWVLAIGGGLLPVGVFLIHYVGLAYSPLQSIGWASVAADFGGFLVLVIAAIELFGLWRRQARHTASQKNDPLLTERSWSSRVLLTGGTLLVLVGFLHGSYYAGAHLFEQEARDEKLLTRMTTQAAAGNLVGASQAVEDYALLQGEKATNIAAHAHVIEFGILALLMAFFQPFVFLSERWKRIWVLTLIAGSIILPVCVLLEVPYGLLFGGLADFGGLLIIVSLTGMLIGVVRYTGALDEAVRNAS